MYRVNLENITGKIQLDMSLTRPDLTGEASASLKYTYTADINVREELPKKTKKTVKRRMRNFARLNRKGLSERYLLIPNCRAKVEYDRIKKDFPFTISVNDACNLGVSFLELILTNRRIIDLEAIDHLLSEEESE